MNIQNFEVSDILKHLGLPDIENLVGSAFTLIYEIETQNFTGSSETVGGIIKSFCLNTWFAVNGNDKVFDLRLYTNVFDSQTHPGGHGQQYYQKDTYNLVFRTDLNGKKLSAEWIVTPRTGEEAIDNAKRISGDTKKNDGLTRKFIEKISINQLKFRGNILQTT